MKWTNKFPTKPGKYWFYGESHMGSMGIDYTDKAEIEPKMYLIDIWEISNGLLGICEGQFMSSTQFDKNKQKEGYLGYFAKAELPEIPEDKLNLFKIGEQ